MDFIKLFLGVLISALLVATTFKLIKPATEGINKHLTSLNDNMAQMSNTEFSGYDQQIMKGSEVASTVELYKEKGVAVLVGVAGNNSGSDIETYNNYGAVLTDINGSGGSSSVPTTNPTTTPTITINKDVFTENKVAFALQYDNSTQELISYKNTRNINMKANIKEFIRPTANFDSRLIRDANNEIIGIAFRQQKN